MNCIRALTRISNNIYFLNKNYNFPKLVKEYAIKSDLKIKWIHPGSVSCISAEKSGDIDQMPVIDNKRFQFEFSNCKELENASDLVKKLFSLEFAPRHKTAQIYINSVTDIARRHPCDIGSAEAKIACWTGCIRSFQEVMDRFPRNKRMKVVLKELIDKRKKLLKHLRKCDYKRFEWLLQNLNIVYKPEPLKEKYFTRKIAMVKLTDKYCDDVKNQRLNKYKLQLEAEQPVFLEGKISMLEFIRKEQTECGVEVTVTQEDIDGVKKLLEELVIKHRESKSEED